VTPTEDIV